MVKTARVTEVGAGFPRIAGEVARTGMPIDALTSDTPLADVTPIPRDAVGVAVGLMDECASVLVERAT